MISLLLRKIDLCIINNYEKCEFGRDRGYNILISKHGDKRII